MTDEDMRAALCEPWGEHATDPAVVATVDTLAAALRAYRVAPGPSADAVDEAAQAAVVHALVVGGPGLSYRVEGVVRLVVVAIEGAILRARGEA